MTNKEKLKTFDLNGKLLGLQDRLKFYTEIKKEYKKKSKVTRQVHTIRMFLLNKNGGIYLAKRSKIKKQNSLLYDKTVGGHIQADESPEYTLIRECAEELGFPAAVLSEPEFLSAIGETNLNIVGVFKEVETLNHFMSHRLHVNGELYVFPQITTVYLGVFDGPIKFKDGETSGVEIYYPDEILKEIKDNPKKYTEDVKVLIPKYLNEIKEIVKQIKKY